MLNEPIENTEYYNLHRPFEKANYKFRHAVGFMLGVHFGGLLVLLFQTL